MCPLPPWDPSEVWPFTNVEPKQGFYVPGVGAGQAPHTQITGMGFTSVRLKKGGALKALGNLKKRDDVFVLGEPKGKGDHQLIFLYTRDVPGGWASYHFAGDRDGDKINNVLTSVDQPSHPFQDTQLSADIVLTDGVPALAYTDFAQPGGFYNLTGEAAYAVWISRKPAGIGIILPSGLAFERFRPLTFLASSRQLRSVACWPPARTSGPSAPAACEERILRCRSTPRAS